METKIKLLDQNTANKIAAGEVVEKPASVVKELVENALDAGATSIQVQIEGGGIEYIRVTDDGSGMSEADARLAVLRHATSKLRTEEDLLYVQTLGFRGEALPSIASVSRFTLLTREAGNEFAVQLKITGGEDLEVSQTGGSIGTSVIVEDLFFNVPARRKFLKTANTEGRYISEMLGKIALARPEVKFTLLSGGRQVLKTPGTGLLEDTIGSLYGGKTKEDVLPVCCEYESLQVTGFVGKPSLVKSSRSWQTLIVNGRIITSRLVSRALDQAYQAQLPKNGYPFAVLNLQLDTTFLDVNVHPQKSEIRFSDEQKVFRAVYRALTEALQKPLESIKVAAAETVSQEAAELEETLATTPQESFSKKPSATYNFADTEVKKHFSYKPQIFKTQPMQVAEQVSLDYSAETKPDFAAAQKTIQQESILSEKFVPTECHSGESGIYPLGQIDKFYIVAQSEDTLYLIDQHAAHERIIFDRLGKKQQDIPVQELLLPVYIELNADDVDLALSYKEVFQELCFDFEAAGPDVLKLVTMPADLDTQQLADFLKQALLFISAEKKPEAAQLRKELIAMASCKAAIKGGQQLNMREMRKLIEELMQTEHPFTCPHGRPIIIQYTSRDLAKMFKRT